MAVSRGLIAYTSLAAGLVALDQWAKYAVETRMGYHQHIDILPYFALFRTHNTGIAFSLLNDMGVGALIIMSLVIIAFVVWIARQSSPEQRIARLGFTMIIAGALGNLIDRVMLGYVVDYFLFYTDNWSFAVFNLADSWITLGAGLVILDELRGWWKQRKASTD